MTDENKLIEFPVFKELNGDEAIAIGERLGAKNGLVVFDCPCGCGRVTSIEIGSPTARDILFWAENLKAQALEDEVERTNGEIS